MTLCRSLRKFLPFGISWLFISGFVGKAKIFKAFNCRQQIKRVDDPHQCQFNHKTQATKECSLNNERLGIVLKIPLNNYEEAKIIIADNGKVQLYRQVLFFNEFTLSTLNEFPSFFFWA